MPVRKAVTRSGKHFRAKFPSRKLRRMVLVESILEAHAALILEHRSDVASYEEQPSVEIYYEADGTPHKYVPDFLATLEDGSSVHIEVKPAAKLLNPALRAKFDLIALRFRETNRQFEIWTDDVIRAEPRFSQFREKQRSQALRLETRPLPAATPPSAGTIEKGVAQRVAHVSKPAAGTEAAHPAAELVQLFDREEFAWLVNFGEIAK